MKTTDFITPTSSLILSVLNIANIIESCYGQYLIHPQAGYYLPHSLEPIPTEIFIVNKTKTALIPYNGDIRKLKCSIYDKYSNIIASDSIMSEQDKYLSSTPKLPVQGLKMVKALVETRIECFLPWVKYQTSQRYIYNLLRNSDIDIYENGSLDRLMESIYQMLDDFIKRDIWFIYFIKYVGLDLVVEKTIDFRIKEWHEKIESGLYIERQNYENDSFY